MKIRKKTVRRWLALFLALTLCMGMPISVFADDILAVENESQADSADVQEEDAGDIVDIDDTDEPDDDADEPEDPDEPSDDEDSGESSGDDLADEDSSDDLDDTETDDSLNDEEDLSDVDSTEDGGQTDDDTENEIEDVSEEKEPLINEVEIPGEVLQFRSLLDAMEAFELTQDNQEEYAALGMQASELLDMLLENYCGYPGMEDDMARFQALVDKQVGGADTLALIKGEEFTVDVVKVVDGEEVDRTPLKPTCLQSTGHSGYKHSTNLCTLANESGFSGYRGYNWSKNTTVPSTYTKGQAPNHNYASVHYNITGSAPYKADETLFLFFGETEFVLKYDANGGSGAPAQQTAKSMEEKYSFTISDKEPQRGGYTFLGWSTNKTAKSPSYYPKGVIRVSGTTTLYAVWKKTQSKEASYTVEWYDTDGNSLKEKETRTGTVGKEVTVTDKDKEVSSYIFDDDNQGNIVSAILKETGTELRLYFEKGASYTYTVEWYDTDGNSLKEKETREGTVGEKVKVTEADKEISGYTFDKENPGNVESDTLSETGTILRLYFIRDIGEPDSTSYTVIREYYVDYVDEENPGKKAETVTEGEISGEVGEEIIGKTLADNKPEWNKYSIDGEERDFTYKGSNPEKLILVKDETQNVITLRYVIEKTPEPTPTPEETPEPTPTPEVTPEPTPTPEETPEPTPTPEVTPEPTPTPEETPEPTPTPEETPEPTPTPEVTPEPMPTPEETPEPTPTPEVTPEPTPERTPTPITPPTATPTPEIPTPPAPQEPEPPVEPDPEPPTPPTPPTRVIEVVPEMPEEVTPDGPDTLVVIPDEDVARAVVYERVQNPVTEEVTYELNEEIPVLEEIPEAATADSPDTVIILDEEVPQAYVKTQDPVTEDYVYIPEEDVPLASIGTPQTGDATGNHWMMLFMMSLGGMIFLLPDVIHRKKNR